MRNINTMDRLKAEAPPMPNNRAMAIQEIYEQFRNCNVSMIMSETST